MLSGVVTGMDFSERYGSGPRYLYGDEPDQRGAADPGRLTARARAQPPRS